MNSIDIATLEDIAAFPQTSRRTAWTDAGNAQTVGDKSLAEVRLWKLTSTIHSPLKRRIETSLFLIISSLGIGLTVYSLDQFATFFHNDSLTQTISLLLLNDV
jgi:hypothetical protein